MENLTLSQFASKDDLIAALQAKVEELTNKLNTDSQTFQIECQKAEIELVREKLAAMTAERDAAVDKKAIAESEYHRMWNLLADAQADNARLREALLEEIKATNMTGELYHSTAYQRR